MMAKHHFGGDLYSILSRAMIFHQVWIILLNVTDMTTRYVRNGGWNILEDKPFPAERDSKASAG